MKTIPDWLAPPPPLPILDRFEVIFELMLEALTEGISLADFIKDYAQSDIADTHDNPITEGRLRRWIFKDKERIARYEEDMELFTLALNDQNLRISDGKNPDGTLSMNDTGRSTLMVKTRKDNMVAFNRKRFGAEPPPINAAFGSNGITINMGTVVSPYTITQDKPEVIEYTINNFVAEERTDECA